MILGLTGGIACGKTEVAKIFQRHSIEVLDADKIVHSLLEEEKIKKEIKKELGDSFFVENKIDRKKLREIVFKNKDKLFKLNSIIHPKVIEIFKGKFYSDKNSKSIIVFDIPLLFEVGMEKFCNKVLVVYVEEKIQIERIKKRDNSSTEIAKKIIESQMSIEEKKKRGDYLIENSGTLEELEKKIVNLIEKILR